jgi:hypothetical protein
MSGLGVIVKVEMSMVEEECVVAAQSLIADGFPGLYEHTIVKGQRLE